MAKQTVSIPIGRLDTSAFPDSSPPGTYRTMQNVVTRQDGFLERRAPWFSTAASTTPGNPEVIADHGDGCAIAVTASGAHVYDRSAAAWKAAPTSRCVTAAGIEEVSYDTARRASLRVSTLDANSELRAANTNVIDSIIVNGYLWMVWSTEGFYSLGKIYMSVYEIDSDGCLGPCVMPQWPVLPTAAYCQPRLAELNEGGVKSVILGVVDGSAGMDATNTKINFYIIAATAPAPMTSITPLASVTTWRLTGGPWWDMTTIRASSTSANPAIAWVKGEAGLTSDGLYVSWLTSAGIVAARRISGLCPNRGVSWCSSNSAGGTEAVGTRGLLVAGRGGAISGADPAENYITGLYKLSFDVSAVSVDTPALLSGSGDQIQITSSVPHRFIGAEIGRTLYSSTYRPTSTDIWWSISTGTTSFVTASYCTSHVTLAPITGTVYVRHGINPMTRPAYKGTITDANEQASVYSVYQGNNINTRWATAGGVNPADAATAGDLQHSVFMITNGPMCSMGKVLGDTASWAIGYDGAHAGKSYGGYDDTLGTPAAIPGGGNWFPNCTTLLSTGATGVSAARRTTSFVVLGRESELDRSGNPANTEAVLVSCDHFPANTFVTGRPTRYNRSTIFPGAKIRRYDNVSYSELGFSLRPETPSVAKSATAGSFTAGGVYGVYVVFYRRDSDGTLHKSAPSYPIRFSPALAGGDKALAVTVQPYYMSDFRYDQVEVYVTANGLGIPYLHATATVDNFAASTVITIVSPVTTSETLYTTSGELPDDTTPSGDILCVWNNRLWVAGTACGNQLRYTRELSRDEPLAWSDAFVVDLPGGTGRVKGLQGANDRLYVFTEDNVYVLGGAGPDAFGDGAYTTPSLLASGTGTIYPGSVVQMDGGVAYGDATGIKLIDGGGNIVDIGAPLNGIFNAQASSATTWGYRPILSIADKLPAEQSTVWVLKDKGLSSSQLLVLNDRKGTWSTWTMPTSYGGINEVYIASNGKWTWLSSRKAASSSTSVVSRYQLENAGVYDHVATSGVKAITTRARTNRLSPAGPGVGVQIHSVALCFSTYHLGATGSGTQLANPTLKISSGHSGQIVTETVSKEALYTDSYVQSEYLVFRYIPSPGTAKCTWFDLEVTIDTGYGRSGLTGIIVEFSPVGGHDKVGVPLAMV